MFGALRVIFSLQLLSAVLAFSILDFEELEEWRRALGRPAAKVTPGTPDVCKKDILILLDTSNSIGQHHYDTDVIPFLKSLVKSPKMNVAPDGTRLSLITFSNSANTKRRLEFGAKTVQEYLNFFNTKLQWNNVHGDRTKTGDATKIADETIFREDSPLNARPNIPDVVLLLTDGEPNGRKKNVELNLALHHTSSMKNKSILIIGIAVGNPTVVKKFNHTILRMATSKKTMFNSAFGDLDKIVDQLVDASCTPFKPGDCDCPTIQSQDVYIKPPQSTVVVSWVEPTLKCNKNRVPNFAATTVSPNISSPHAFGAGDHDIEYKYTFRGGFDLKCYVKISVRSCACQSHPAVTAYVLGDNDLATAQWVAPVPSCSATLQAIQPNKPSGSSFALGDHKVSYLYNTVAGFDLTCGVDIYVRKCSCQSTNEPEPFYIKPDNQSGKMNVTWAEPKLDCAGKSTKQLTISPKVKPGDSFGVGKHSVVYTYDMNGGMRLQCSATFEVKVVPCGEADYTPATQICCCGKVHNKFANRECCGRKPYDSSKQKCCLNYNIRNINAPCPGEDVSV